MATVAHIIRSHYDPADRERLEHETGQTSDDLDPWQTESSSSALHRPRAPPTFVPATVIYDEWGVPLRTPSSGVQARDLPAQDLPSSQSVAEWYRSLRPTTTTPSARPASAPPPSSPDATPGACPPHGRVTKNDWFIRNALRSVPPPETKPHSRALSLADILVRDPPPLPSEARHVPPVWLHIGPSNVGFGMLQRSGWREGEGLGAGAVRAPVARGGNERLFSADVGTGRETIDLTLSDSNSEASEDTLEDDEIAQISVRTHVPSDQASGPHMQKSLLTPLPTVLKADRLGIGLKAKTEGPYRQSKKRVTHGAAALAAHIRSAEEMRKWKATFGKGRRGLAKAHRREEDKRKAMLAYFNE